MAEVCNYAWVLGAEGEHAHTSQGQTETRFISSGLSILSIKCSPCYAIS